MIELYQFPPIWGFNLSPFCFKVEVYCRLAELPYRSAHTMPNRGPRGKLPFIVDESERVADSANIIDYLKRTYGDPLDKPLSVGQRARGHMLRRLCEESLYFVLVYSRWLDDDHWPGLKDAFFGKLPPGPRQLIPWMVQRRLKRSLVSQGYGRHPKAEVYDAGRADLEAINWQLTQNDFAVGARVSSFDASLYAFLVNIVRVPIETPLKTAATEQPAIGTYLDRMDVVLEGKPSLGG